MSGVIIAGAGQAGVDTAAALRAGGFEGDVTLVSDEGAFPYSRPFLSKEFLAGQRTEDQIVLRPQSFYDDKGIRLVLGRPVVSVDRAGRTVRLSSGEELRYDTLVLATGGSPRRLPDPVLENASNVHYVRSLADAVPLRGEIVAGGRMCVLGGGYVGLEISSVARQAGMSVMVIEAAPRLLARVAGAELADFVANLHQTAGVDVRLGTQASAFRVGAAGRVAEVMLANGEVLPTDVLVIGIGITPNDALARDCGLETADGIVVDEYCRTADPHVYAVGDCTRHPCAEWGGLRRLESISNASGQARAAASSILGQPTPYTSTPWFWSTQLHKTMRTVGLRGNSDKTVVRANNGTFAAFYLADGTIKAADIVGSPREFAAARRLVEAKSQVDPDDLADPDVPLATLLEASRGDADR
jgi:3-phenylpropionate/trans-cinnamate dioxygenase ferredoxin reductase component